VNWGTVGFNLVVFVFLQVLAQLAMKFGSKGTIALRSRRWWLGFIMANGVGAPSILFFKEVYRLFPDHPNLVAAVVTAMCFLASQAALALMFRSRLSRVQYAGTAMIALGAILACLGTSSG
jgi:hypothetical protein